MARQFGAGPGSRNSKTGLIVALAMIVVGAFLASALYLLGNSSGRTPGMMTQGPAQPAPEQFKTKDVLIALREIQSAEELNPSMFRIESRMAAAVSDQAVGSYEGIQGQFAKRTISLGQELTLQDVSNSRPTNAISDKIPEGFRAVTIRVDEVTSVEGFARPGARVDVIWIATQNGKPASTTIVENAQVLSAERVTEQGAEKKEAGVPVPSTVTLLVSTADSSKIQLASSTGKLQLSLRGDEDPGIGGKPREKITVDDLWNQGVKPVERPLNNEGWVEIGGQKFDMIDGRLQPAGRGAAKR